MRILFTTIAAAMLAVISVPTAHASIQGVASAVASGGFGTSVVEDIIETGDDLRNNGDFSANNTLFLLGASFGHILSADYDVEHDGSPGAPIEDDDKVSDTLAAGTLVNAYQIRHDRTDNSLESEQLTVTFNNDIIGLNGGADVDGATHQTSYEEFTDLVAGTTFQTGGGTFAFDDDGGNDVIVEITPDRRTLTVKTTVASSAMFANNFDQLWVITAVPEPSTYAVFAGLAFCFGAAGWWRKRKLRR